MVSTSALVARLGASGAAEASDSVHVIAGLSGTVAVSSPRRFQECRKDEPMPSNLDEQTLTTAVQRSFDTSTDERFRQLFVSLVQHLHDFTREVRLTGEEW